MNPRPTTLETRRRAAIARCAEGVAHPEPDWHSSVLLRLQAVVDLGPSPSAEAIIAAQTAVTTYGAPELPPVVKCDGCDRSVERAVEVGEEPDYDTSTATLCRDCLLGALAALDEAP